jgi:hypothetical protein
VRFYTSFSYQRIAGISGGVDVSSSRLRESSERDGERSEPFEGARIHVNAAWTKPSRQPGTDVFIYGHIRGAMGCSNRVVLSGVGRLTASVAQREHSTSLASRARGHGSHVEARGVRGADSGRCEVSSVGSWRSGVPRWTATVDGQWATHDGALAAVGAAIEVDAGQSEQ